MKSLNEKLAVEVMGWKVHDLYPGWYWEQLADSSLEGRCRIESWNPTQDLNQLRECYLAAEKSWHQHAAYSFEHRFYEELYLLLDFRRDEPKRLTTAWINHPELVAQAILKAKGVE